jgi:pimeloyl-ACP methyl ester carboxylesterase
LQQHGVGNSSLRIKIAVSTKKLLHRSIKFSIVFYLLLCVALYFLQEKLIFFPDKLDKNFRFDFSSPFEEHNIKTTDGILLHGLLFKAAEHKGLVLFLHGNGGSLRQWGETASLYTALGYDVFLLDYRGYGKSEGRIQSQQQLFGDVQAAYTEMKKQYNEDSIVVIGYSIGTGPAAKLASTNHPKLLVLQAPYYNLTDMMKHRYPFIPTFLLQYSLETNKYLQQCASPVILFHGDADGVIPYTSSVRLKAECKMVDTLVTLRGQGHNGITANPQYAAAIRQILR